MLGKSMIKDRVYSLWFRAQGLKPRMYRRSLCHLSMIPDASTLSGKPIDAPLAIISTWDQTRFRALKIGGGIRENYRV